MSWRGVIKLFLLGLLLVGAMTIALAWSCSEGEDLQQPAVVDTGKAAHGEAALHPHASAPAQREPVAPEPARPVDVRTRFTDTQWSTVQNLLSSTWTTFFVECRVVEVVSPVYWRLQVVNDARPAGMERGDELYVWDGSFGIVRDHVEFKGMQLGRDMRVGRQGWMLIRRVLWRHHLLLVALE